MLNWNLLPFCVRSSETCISSLREWLNIFIIVYIYSHILCMYLSLKRIRASVDALCRDGADEMSRDPRTKASKTRRERLAMPSKYPKDHSRGPYLLIHMPKCILCPCKSYYRNPLIRDFTIFVSSYSSSSSSLDPISTYRNKLKR